MQNENDTTRSGPEGCAAAPLFGFWYDVADIRPVTLAPILVIGCIDGEADDATHEAYWNGKHFLSVRTAEGARVQIYSVKKWMPMPSAESPGDSRCMTLLRMMSEAIMCMDFDAYFSLNGRLQAVHLELLADDSAGVPNVPALAQSGREKTSTKEKTNE